MKFSVNINSRKCLFTASQLERLIDVLSDGEVYEEIYVGTGKGSTGSNNNYNPVIKPSSPDEWFEAKIMRDDFVETIKLRMKLEAES
jgi:hypothetical protein